LLDEIPSTPNEGADPVRVHAASVARAGRSPQPESKRSPSPLRPRLGAAEVWRLRPRLQAEDAGRDTTAVGGS
jgi:hypothetical protein